MKAVQNTTELMERINALPAFSKIVYDAIQASMYAEPGFSDTMPCDIAKELKVSVKAIGGALTELQEQGLIWLDTDGVNGVPMTFIHTYEHDNEIERNKTAVIASIKIGIGKVSLPVYSRGAEWGLVITADRNDAGLFEDEASAMLWINTVFGNANLWTYELVVVTEGSK